MKNVYIIITLDEYFIPKLDVHTWVQVAYIRKGSNDGFSYMEI